MAAAALDSMPLQLGAGRGGLRIVASALEQQQLQEACSLLPPPPPSACSAPESPPKLLSPEPSPRAAQGPPTLQPSFDEEPAVEVHDPVFQVRLCVPCSSIEPTEGLRNYRSKRKAILCVHNHPHQAPSGPRAGCTQGEECNQIHVNAATLAQLRSAAQAKGSKPMSFVRVVYAIDPATGRTVGVPFRHTEGTLGRDQYRASAARNPACDGKPVPEPCQDCRGTGRIGGRRCQACDGTTHRRFQFCQSFLSGHCSKRKLCQQIHVKPDQWRRQACCWLHGNPRGPSTPSLRVGDVTVPAQNVAVTRGLTSLSVSNGVGYILPQHICRFHQEGYCKQDEQCEQIHICRLFYDLRLKQLTQDAAPPASTPASEPLPLPAPSHINPNASQVPPPDSPSTNRVANHGLPPPIGRPGFGESPRAPTAGPRLEELRVLAAQAQHMRHIAAAAASPQEDEHNDCDSCCCAYHGACSVSALPQLPSKVYPPQSLNRIPHDRLAPTVGLWEAAARNPFSEHESSTMRDSLVIAVCPNHLDPQGCRNGERCKLVHVCREWYKHNVATATPAVSRKSKLLPITQNSILIKNPFGASAAMPNAQQTQLGAPLGALRPQGLPPVGNLTAQRPSAVPPVAHHSSGPACKYKPSEDLWDPKVMGDDSDIVGCSLVPEAQPALWPSAGAVLPGGSRDLLCEVARNPCDADVQHNMAGPLPAGPVLFRDLSSGGASRRRSGGRGGAAAAGPAT